MSTDLTIADAQSAIFTLPNRPPFMLDSDLAEFYGTRTDLINTAVKRNLNRFPEDFVFRLTEDEFRRLTTQNALSNVSSGRGGTRHSPWAFTQAGSLALSGVLKTPRAAEVSVMVFRAFAALSDKSAELEHIRRAAERLRAHVLADRPYWNKIARYWDLGLGVHEIAQLLRRPVAEVKAHHQEMKRCGAIASKVLETGAWIDCTGPLPGHAQDKPGLAMTWDRGGASDAQD